VTLKNTIDPTGRFPSSWALFALSLGVMASTIMKLSRLDQRELWLDETRSPFFATVSFHDLLRYSLCDAAPLIFHSLLRVWVRLVGRSTGGSAHVLLRDEIGFRFLATVITRRMPRRTLPVTLQ
jgi:hypothetical protein